MGYTPENNPYIPGDPYSYDLAWMVQEVKAAQQVGQNAQQYANDALQSKVEAQQAKDLSMAWAIGEDDGGPIPPGEPQYENNAKYYSQEAENSASDAADSAEAAANSVEPLNTRMNVIESRMDTFTNLSVGSTTGDAELMDARIAFNGSVYPNAGDAIRGQFGSLAEMINLQDASYPYFLEEGGINGSGSEFGELTGTYMRFADYIPTALATGMIFKDKAEPLPGTYSLFCCYYDSSKVFVRRDTTDTGYQIDTQQPYFRLSFYDRDGNNETLYRSWISWLLPNAAKVSIDDLETRVSRLEDNGSLSKTGDTITINTPKASYTFMKVVDNAIHLDTWRLYAGYLKTGATPFNMWLNSDAEGVVKIQGETDFIGGFHGDEVFSDIKVILDGNDLDLSQNYSDLAFSILEIYVKSTLYHVGSATPAFSRNKRLTFSKNKVTVSNYLTALENLRLQQAALAMFQCYRDDSGNNEILHSYSVNSDFAYYDINNTNVYPENSKNLTGATFNTEYGSISVLTTKLDPNYIQYYNSDVSIQTLILQNRLKIYFNTIPNTMAGIPIAAGEHIFCEFEWDIK